MAKTIQYLKWCCSRLSCIKLELSLITSSLNCTVCPPDPRGQWLLPVSY